MSWSDWSINKQAMLYILKELSKNNKTILEFGSGNTTELLSECFDVTSVEENIEWVNKFDSEYIYAPIKNDWYNLDSLKKSGIENKKFDIIIIDGPAHGKRHGFLDNLDFFNIKDSMIIIDDIERDDDATLLKKIEEIKNKLNNKVSSTTIGNTAFIL